MARVGTSLVPRPFWGQFSSLASVTLPLYRDLTAGWQLLAGGAGSDTGGLPLFGYAGGSYQSVTATNLSAGQGYWVKFASTGTATLIVVPVPLTFHLVMGWNLVGNSTAQTLTLPMGITAFVYDGASYQSTNALQPGQGAWVRSTADQDITLAPLG